MKQPVSGNFTNFNALESEKKNATKTYSCFPQIVILGFLPTLIFSMEAMLEKTYRDAHTFAQPQEVIAAAAMN